MDLVLIIIGVVFVLASIVGCVLPVLPGPLLGFVGLLLLHFTEGHHFGGSFLLTWAVITAVVTLIDYWLPVWSVKKSGAGRLGVWGGVIGLLFGLILFPPFGIIIGPFMGAVLGELLSGKKAFSALKAGTGSFLGFFVGMLLKLMAAGMMAWCFFAKLFGG